MSHVSRGGGSNPPKPTVQQGVSVILGGVVERPMTDGYLTTSILNPSHKIAGYPKEQGAINRALAHAALRRAER
jgi:hypothetical protein